MRASRIPLMKTYKFKLYSNHGNRELHKTIDGHAEVWNHCVAVQRRYYGIYGKYISKFRLINHLSNLKRLPRFAHWKRLPSQAIQDVAVRLDKGYKAMFEARATGKAWGRPRFKSRRKYKSFTLLQAGWKLLPSNKIRIGKQVYQYFKSRDVCGNPKRCTIKRDGLGDVYICILTDHVAPDLNRPTTGKIAGFDFGFKRYLTGHNGHDVDSPQFFKRSLNAIKRAHRKHSRTKKKSKNRERARQLGTEASQNSNPARGLPLAHQLTDQYDSVTSKA